MEKEFILSFHLNGKDKDITAVNASQVKALESQGAKILYIARLSATENTPVKNAKFFHDGKNKEIEVFGNSDREMHELIEQAFEGATRITLTASKSNRQKQQDPAERQNPAAFILILLAALVVLMFVPIFIMLNLFGKMEGVKKLICKIRKTEYKKKVVVRTPFGEKMRKLAIAFAIVSEVALGGGIVFMALGISGVFDASVAMGIGEGLLAVPIVYDIVYFVLRFVFKKQNKLYEQEIAEGTAEEQAEKSVVEKSEEKVETVTVSKIMIGKREFKKSEIEQLFAYVWMRNYNELPYDEAFEKLNTYLTESGLIDGEDVTYKDIEHLLTLIWARRYNDLKFDDALNKITEHLTVDYDIENIVPISIVSDDEAAAECCKKISAISEKSGVTLKKEKKQKIKKYGAIKWLTLFTALFAVACFFTPFAYGVFNSGITLGIDFLVGTSTNGIVLLGIWATRISLAISIIAVAFAIIPFVVKGKNGLTKQGKLHKSIPISSILSLTSALINFVSILIGRVTYVSQELQTYLLYDEFYTFIGLSIMLPLVIAIMALYFIAKKETAIVRAEETVSQAISE